MKWTTFDGRQLEYADLSHQHLSNIYWFHKVLFSQDNWVIKRRCSAAEICRFTVDFLNEKFDGKILDYSPHPDCKSEVDALNFAGLLHWFFDEQGIRKAKIIFEGKIIGEFCEREWMRQEKIISVLK